MSLKKLLFLSCSGGGGGSGGGGLMYKLLSLFESGPAVAEAPLEELRRAGQHLQASADHLLDLFQVLAFSVNLSFSRVE